MTLFILEALSILLDLATSLIDNNYTAYSQTVVLLWNIAFFMVYFMRQRMFFVYFRSVVHGEDLFRGTPNYVYSFVTHALEAVAIMSIWTGWLCYVDESGYHMGPLHWLINAAGFVYVALTMWQVILDRKHYDSMEYLATWMLNTVILVGNIFLIIHPYDLTRDYFYSIALLIIYLRFQDPNVFTHGETGIFNRRAYQQYMREIIAKNKRVWIEGAVVSNYSNLKRIYGEDQIHKGVKEIGQFHKKAFRQMNAFYLTGGRFLVVSTKPLTHDDYMWKIAFGERNAAENGVVLPASFVSLSQETDFKNAGIMMGCISKAFEQAQEPGQNLVTIDEKWVKQYEEDIRIQKALGEAVLQNKVECYLQPIYSVAEDRIVGAEALARIVDENGDVIPPDRFIPMAEQNGQILSVGEQVFTKVCEFLESNATNIRFVNVNLSPIQCLQDGPTERLMQIAKNHKVDPSKIIMEITEEVMIDDTVLRDRMKRLAMAGYHLSLDDFGSGTANLNRTLSFRFNEIKLDKDLVKHMCEESYEAFSQMVRDINAAGRDLVAEGIETKEMAEHMAKLGCHYLQGYYYSKPLPMNEFIEKYEKV